jgi:hypothetical protein
MIPAVPADRQQGFLDKEWLIPPLSSHKSSKSFDAAAVDLVLADWGLAASGDDLSGSSAEGAEGAGDGGE